MLSKRFDAIVEEIGEIQNLQELKALWCFGQSEGNEYMDADCVPLFKAAVARLKTKPPVQVKVEKEVVNANANVLEKIEDLLRQIEELKSKAPIAASVAAPVARSGRRYRLLSKNVSWSTRPQVHALMKIIAEHAEVGDILDEADIVRMVVANECVLNTRQSGRRVWDYYKGNHNDGLMAHGNIERA